MARMQVARTSEFQRDRVGQEAKHAQTRRRVAVLPFNDDALRAQVESDFALLARGVEDEAQLNKIFDLVMDATVRALRDSMHDSNQSSPSARLPPEILSACFSLLDLDDGIHASHVSRLWRAIALSTPQVWSTLVMDCDKSSQFEFAAMVLARSGSLANCRIDATYPTPATSFDALILPHIHKIRFLEWFSPFHIDSLRHSSPFLEHLRMTSGMMEIPHDFLGGQAARLRSLRCDRASLPDTCPALSALVELRIDRFDGADAASFSGLFDLCPRLESLTLRGLQAAQSHLLPSGPAPTSLRKLCLKSQDDECDLMRQFLAWNTPNLRCVSLDMVRSGRHNHGPLGDPFLSGAQVLSIREPDISGPGTWIVGEGPDGCEYSIGLPEIYIPRLVVLILDCKPRLQNVHTVNITIDVLEHFEPIFAALPALTNVKIYLESMAHAQAGPVRNPPPQLPGWEALECVENILNAAPKLELLIIDVWLSWNATGNFPTAGDAQDILWYLRFLEHRPHVPDIRIRGLSAETLRDMDLNGLPVHFDSEESVAEGGFWPFQVEYR